jgi:methylation protein EvaC
MPDEIMTVQPVTPPVCRVCGGAVSPFLDFGRQPLSDRFLRPEETDEQFFFRLAVGCCAECTMVQLLEEAPRELMFNEGYPYYSSGSSVMRKHFAETAHELLARELNRADSFMVEIGCNDGALLGTISEAGVRHLGFEPTGVGEVAKAKGVRVRAEFFEAQTAARVRAAEGCADVIYAANTICHIPYLDSVFAGVDALLGPSGVFVFEDPYLGDIVRQTSFDQIYDEHFFLFSARSVLVTARRFGFELVDVRHLPVHGGEIRYTLARAGARTLSSSVGALLAEEDRQGLADVATLRRFAADVAKIREDLVVLLTRLRDEGRLVVGYGATAKSATVTNYCGIDQSLIPYICDTTPAKQGRLTPGMHIPVRPSEGFSDPYPDFALLFAWNHADEIIAKEQAFRRSGGKWIIYVPEVHLK